MTMQVTMLQTRMGESGSLLTAGSSYTVSKAFGAMLVGSGYATDTQSALTPPATSLSPADVVVVKALVSGDGNAPATLDATNAAAFNGATVKLAAGATLTVHDGAWALLAAEIIIKVGQSGSATLAFSGAATKENASGTSASSVTLAASGVYALTRSPTGSPLFRLNGGASL